MALRKKVGDVFVVPVDDKYKRYFQYLGIDATGLSSHLIRVFKKSYDIDKTLKLEDIVNDEVDFHAHVVLQFGLKNGTWEKVGNVAEIKPMSILFKIDSFFEMLDTQHLSPKEFGKEWDKAYQLGETRKKNNANWSIWCPNDKQLTFVGKLTDEYKNAEFGGVFPPDAILKKMRTGKYQGWGIND